MTGGPPRCPVCGAEHDGACPRAASADPVRTTRREQPKFPRWPPPRGPSPLPASGPLSPPLPRTELLDQVIGGKYRLTQVLGAGGMGTVFEASNLNVGGVVAVKVLHPDELRRKTGIRRFHQEARRAGAIGHPNICEVYDLGALPDGCPYLVMERLSGETVADRILRERRLPVEDAIDVAAQILSALHAAHDKGIVHRDIKPENLFLAERAGLPPIVKVLDFGVSKLMRPVPFDALSVDTTNSGVVLGTPYYMAPEQARGERDLDPRVDLYACGVVLYEMVTGVRPFTAQNYNALLVAILNAVPVPARRLLPSLPRGIDALLERAMARAREDRYQSATEFQSELQQLKTHLTRTSMPPPSGEVEQRFLQLTGAFGRFSAHYAEARADGVVTDEERAELERDLRHVGTQARVLEVELGRKDSKEGRPKEEAGPRTDRSGELPEEGAEEAGKGAPRKDE